MKTNIDKEYTTIANAGRVRADLKEFKARYTDGDLLREFRDQTGLVESYGHEVFSASVTGFPGGTDYNNNTHFCVELTTGGLLEFCKIRFYCDMSLTIDTREAYCFGDPQDNPHLLMYSQRVFKEVKA